ncbi:glycosyltransferase [Sphingobacterium corticis]|uniref:Glycosyltransferase n=1 Tax=Sphingobacterium corticis TaxID=1812823 RepID=A0ABW5NKG2_9SPHI
MLSIIISSYNAQYFEALEKNISKTCGIPYEIIKIHNPGIYGICEAYNIGADKSSFENLVFCHEDIDFFTNDWGKILLEELELPNCGIIGLAGAKYYPNAPIGYWQLNTQSMYNIVQVANGKSYHYKINQSQPVEVLDGVLLAVKKENFSKFRFNQNLIGFHAYEIDLSWRASQSLTNYVTSRITVKHYSNGNPDKNWFLSLLDFSNDRPDRIQYTEINNRLEGFALYIFSLNTKKHFPSKRDQIKLLYKYFSFRYLGVVGIFSFIKHYIYRTASN